MICLTFTGPQVRRSAVRILYLAGRLATLYIVLSRINDSKILQGTA